jgi:hypothetical protein
MLKLAVALAVPLSLMVATIASTSFLVVDVRPDDGPRIVVPVPLILVQAATAFVPEEEIPNEIPEEAREYLPVAKAALQALREVPDAEIVRVESPDEQVLIRVVDDMLEIRVQGSDGEDVEVNVPLETAEDIIEEVMSDDFHPADVVRALRRVSRTDLVKVNTGDEHVKVWIW